MLASGLHVSQGLLVTILVVLAIIAVLIWILRHRP
jgi:flagellar biogenesis protein FliO